MNSYKCIIFDCDGVLVDSEPIGNQVLADLANKYGADIDVSYALKYFKGKAFNTSKTEIETLIGKALPPDFEKQYRELSYAAFKRHIKPIPYVKSVLSSLEIPFCVASSGPEEKIKLNLKHTGLLPFFNSRIYSCYTINKWKPDPAVFLWAAKSMGFKPKDCVVIEDSETGIAAAKSGGFNVLVYDPEASYNYTNSFKNMKELKTILVK